MATGAALIGAAVIGGIASNSASQRASRSADKNRETQLAGMDIQREQLRFNEQRYLDTHEEYLKWKEIYGPLQEDVGTYYRNLSGEMLSNKEVERIQLASQEAQNKLSKQLAQTGLNNSGFEAQALTDIAFQTELSKASARSTADERAMRAKSSFLNVGLAEANRLRGAEANTASFMSNSASNITSQYNNIGRGYLQEADAQNRIWSKYGDNLTGLVGYGYGHNLFGSTTGNQSIQSYLNSLNTQNSNGTVVVPNRLGD